jgi:peptidoglycan endopeptidase LytE
MSNRQGIASQVAWSMIGKPYIWGGDDPVLGFDCSGFVIEIMKSVGVLPKAGDWTAAELWSKFADRRVEYASEGHLVFWKNASGSINHVEYCLDDKHSIGASGGCESTTTVADAVAQNAYIMVRPISSRLRRAGYVDPFK